MKMKAADLRDALNSAMKELQAYGESEAELESSAGEIYDDDDDDESNPYPARERL